MWMLFQDFQNTSTLLKVGIIGGSTAVTYLFSWWYCRRFNIFDAAFIFLSPAAGAAVALSFSAIYFSFWMYLFFSLMGTWLRLRKSN